MKGRPEDKAVTAEWERQKKKDRQRIDAFERDWDRRRSELSGCRGIINGVLMSAALLACIATFGIIAGWW